MPSASKSKTAGCSSEWASVLLCVCGSASLWCSRDFSSARFDGAYTCDTVQSVGAWEG